MKSKIAIILVISVILCAQSCKKKKDGMPEQEQPTLPPTQPEPPPSKLDGVITSFYNYSFKADSSRFQYGQIQASFYKQSHDVDSLHYLITDADVGDIKVNGKLFQKSKLDTRITYNYSPNTLQDANSLINSRNWNIAGNESYTESNFVESTAIPQYLHNTSFPDTIYKYKNNEFKIGLVQNADSAMINIREVDGTGSSDYRSFGKFTKQVIFGKESFYLITPFYQFSFVEIEITFSKKTYQKIGGKTLQFLNHIYYKSSPIPFKAYE